MKEILSNQLQEVAALYPTISYLDEEGKLKEGVEVEVADEVLVEIMNDMIMTRTLNDRSTLLSKQGRLGFFAPTYGQEASMMASYKAFNHKDPLFPGYRDIPQLIKHGLPIYKAFLWSKGHVLGNEYPQDLRALPPQIIIGAQYVQAVGSALGLKLKETKQVAFTYTGDGGSSQGDFYEAINFAGSLKVPIVFIIQNNGYAITTPRKVQSVAPTLAQKAASAGIIGFAVDGMDALAVYMVTKQAREYALENNAPVLIEIISNRLQAHSLSGDDPSIYRSKEDIEDWISKEPIKRFMNYLESKNLYDQEMYDAQQEEINLEIDEAIILMENAPTQKISKLLNSMYKNNDYITNEQIAIFKAKEANTDGN